MNLNDFLIKLFGSSDSQKEYDQFENWKKEGLANAKSLQELLAINENAGDLKGYKTFDVESALMANLEQIDSEEKVTTHSGTNKNRNLLIILLGILTLSISGYFLYQSINSQEAVFIADKEGIENLDNGTIVHLNRESSYTFDKLSNHLILNGEAHFDVAKQEKAFEVETQHGIIKVLGTSFNVRTYPDKTTIYMHEGVVEFTTDEKTIVLKEGDFISSESDFEVSNSATSQLVSYWKDKKLSYNNVALTQVLDDLNRLFNKNLRVKDVDTDEILITSSFDGNSLEEILLILETISNLDII